MFGEQKLLLMLSPPSGQVIEEEDHQINHEKYFLHLLRHRNIHQSKLLFPGLHSRKILMLDLLLLSRVMRVFYHRNQHLSVVNKLVSYVFNSNSSKMLFIYLNAVLPCGRWFQQSAGTAHLHGKTKITQQLYT